MKFVNENISDFLKPKSEEDIYKSAEESDQLWLLHGWRILIEYPSLGASKTSYLEDYHFYHDLNKSEFKFTNDKNKAYPFHYYNQAVYISKLLDSNYFRQINTSKVEKIPSSNMPTTLSRTDEGFKLEESLKGGKGDKLTTKDVCPKQLAIGKKVEKEHTSSTKNATEIALDHLAENDKYYSELVERGIVDEPAAIREYIKHFGKDKLPKKLLKLVEGVGDKYASKEFGIPDEDNMEDYSINALRGIGYTIVGIIKDFPVFKNPRSLEIFPPGSRGVITDEGDLYLIPDAMNIIHENIIKFLDKNRIIYRFIPQWENVIDNDLPDYVSVQRVWDKNTFALSNSYMFKKINKEEILPKFEPFIEAAREKNPQFEFVNDRLASVIKERLTPEEKEMEMKNVFR